MNAQSEKIDPKTELELGLNYSSQCIQKILNNDSSAGANATSRLENTTFVASGPLSELVWSADKGLSLKCADSSFAKNPSHFWDVGPSNKVLSQTRNIFGGMSAAEEFQDDAVLKPDAALCVMGDIAGTSTPTGHPTVDSSVMAECKASQELDKGSSGNTDEIDTAGASNMLINQKENPINSMEKNTCSQANNGSDEISGIKGDKSSAISGHKRSVDVLSPHSHEPKPSMEENPQPRSYSCGGGSDVGNGAGATGTTLASSSRSPFEILESTAENDLQTANCEATRGAVSRIQAAKHNEYEDKSNENENEMMLLCDKKKNFSVADSPRKSRTHMLKKNKGKEKGSSDGDVNVTLLEGNDSHESVESCNSTGMFSMGKKRWGLPQQLIVGSKRAKRKIPETSGFKSLVKQDSSFINWISNLMKGFSQSFQPEANSSALALGHSGNGHQWLSQKLIIENKDQDVEQKIMGFQSIFQSIYTSSLKNLGKRISSANHHPREGCRDFELADKVDGIDATPLTCCAENNSLYKPWRYDSVPSSQPKIESINFVKTHESSQNESVEDDKACWYLEPKKEKEDSSSNSSSGKQKTNNENIDSSTISERKLAANSLWITRFSSKPTSPLEISDHLNQTRGTHEHSTGFSKLPHSHKPVACLNKCKVEETGEQIETKESQNCSIHKEVSTGPKNNNSNNDHKPMHLLNPVSPSSGFRNSEPMASIFARRLDAFRHIIPSNQTDDHSRANKTCLFCRTRGHQIHDCSEISEVELEDLLKNVNSFMGLEKLTCLCIKCFQPNHWAIACPTLISRGNHELEANTWVNDCCPSGIQSTAGNAGNARLLNSEEDQHISAGAIADRADPIAEKNLNLKQQSNEITALEKIEINKNSSSEENKLTVNPMTSSSSFVDRKISDLPKKIFDAVKRLRFSRTEILKWINSHMSISNLDGFFLRLRLGKWEEGLGGTGYYVASINGSQRLSSEKNSRISLSVNVGGIKCMVQSQYISNQEFLEDEIMAWWCTTSKAGGKIPCEEELMEKIKRKKMLGF